MSEASFPLFTNILDHLLCFHSICLSHLGKRCNLYFFECDFAQMKEQAESQPNVNSPMTNSVGWYYPSAMQAGTVERGPHFIKAENEKYKANFPLLM